MEITTARKQHYLFTVRQPGPNRQNVAFQAGALAYDLDEAERIVRDRYPLALRVILEDVNTEPLFSSEAQECFAEGSRVFTVTETIRAGKGAEGTYVGSRNGVAIVDFDTPSGEPCRLAVTFDAIRNLYR